MEEQPLNKRAKLAKIQTNTWNSFSHYSEESSIHSMSYIGKKNLHWIERIFWICAFFFSFSLCSYFIYLTYDKWNRDPMLVTFNDRSTPTWHLPFPAITICPESKTDIKKFNLTYVLSLVSSKKNLTRYETNGLNALYQICDIITENVNDSKTNFITTLRMLKNNFAKMSNISIANGKKFQPMTDYFREIVTEEGVCQTFNMLDEKDLYKKTMSPFLRYPKHFSRSNWTTFGYDEKADAHTHPMRILGAGKKAGVTIQLEMMKRDIDYACKETSGGFRLALHTPDEMPQMASRFYKIPFGVETLISVHPRVMSTSENLKHYKPKLRQCYFRGEKRLKFFRAYTQANCKLECFTEYILERCGCVRFNMPHDIGTKICEDFECINKGERDFILSELGKDIENEKKDDKTDLKDQLKSLFDLVEPENSTDSESATNTSNDKPFDVSYDYKNDEYVDPHADQDDFASSCKCLPSCSSIHYDTELSQTTFDIIKYYKANKAYVKQDDQIVHAFVSIYFKEDHFVESKRSELYDWINFLSNCGGFLGLLMGGSLLSLVEIIYHLTLKKIFRRRHERYDADTAAVKEKK